MPAALPRGAPVAEEGGLVLSGSAKLVLLARLLPLWELRGRQARSRGPIHSV
jgi:hypothetical protein